MKSNPTNGGAPGTKTYAEVISNGVKKPLMNHNLQKTLDILTKAETEHMT
jgi:hypothetical protein